MYLNNCPKFWFLTTDNLRLKLQIFKILKRVEIVDQKFYQWEDDNHMTLERQNFKAWINFWSDSDFDCSAPVNDKSWAIFKILCRLINTG